MRLIVTLYAFVVGCAGGPIFSPDGKIRHDPARCSPDLQTARDIAATAERACSYERMVGGIEGADQACDAIAAIGKPGRDAVYWAQTQCPIYQLSLEALDDAARLAAISRRLALTMARLEQRVGELASEEE